MKFTGKHQCQDLFFNKVAGLRLATLLKKTFWHRRFPVSFAKFLRTPFLQNTSGRLLLYINMERKENFAKKMTSLPTLHSSKTVILATTLSMTQHQNKAKLNWKQVPSMDNKCQMIWSNNTLQQATKLHQSGNRCSKTKAFWQFI